MTGQTLGLVQGYAGTFGRNVLRAGRRMATRSDALLAGLLDPSPMVRQASRTAFGQAGRRLLPMAGWGALGGAGLGIAGQMAGNVMNGDGLFSGTLGAGLRGAAFGGFGAPMGFGAYRMAGRRSPSIYRDYRFWQKTAGMLGR